MKRLLPFVMMLLIGASAYGATISGHLVYPEGSAADSFLVLITNQFEDLTTGTAMGGAFHPDFEFSVTGEFDDTTSLYAFAAIPGPAIVPSSGDPAGVYPESPFHLVDGIATDIIIPIASHIDVEGNVQWSGSFENVYVNFYNLYETYSTGDTVVEIENIEVDNEGHFIVEDCPSGPKAVVAYIDENENMTFDEGTEPFARLENDLMGVLVVGGGHEADIMAEQLNLDLWEVKEANPKPENLGIYASPNPFNGAVTISYNIDETQNCKLQIFDNKGNLVRTLEQGYKDAGNHIARWDAKGQFGQSLSTGIYTVKLSSPINSVDTKVIYLK